MKYSKVKELYKRNLMYKEKHGRISTVHAYGYHTYAADTCKANLTGSLIKALEEITKFRYFRTNLHYHNYDNKRYISTFIKDMFIKESQRDDGFREYRTNILGKGEYEGIELVMYIHPDGKTYMYSLFHNSSHDVMSKRVSKKTSKNTKKDFISLLFKLRDYYDRIEKDIKGYVNQI